MPKRLCPFDRHLSLCLKTHISEREVNMGVKSGEHMALVYEKTVALLYQGARNVSNNNTSVQQPRQQPLDAAMVIASGALETDMVASSPLRQMCISKEGVLCREQCLQFEISSRKSMQLRDSSCPSCNTSQCVMFGCCHFCERFCCEDCLKPCVSCGDGDFCKLCSVNRYSAEEEGRQCLSCCK